MTALEFERAPSWHATPEEQLIEREDQAEVERVTCAVLARLSERQRPSPPSTAAAASGRRSPSTSG